MPFTQKLFVLPLLVGLAGVLVLQHLLSENYQALGVVKYTLNSMIFVISLLYLKPTREHHVLGWAFKFIYLADFFFVFLGTVPGFSPEDPLLNLCGLTVFALGYFCFIWISLQGAQWNRREWLIWLPILLVALPVGGSCFVRMRSDQTVFFFLFVPFVSFVGWSGLSSLVRTTFKPEIRSLLALSGVLFFLSEMAFSVGSFYPGYHRNMPWIGNAIWATYIPGWIALLCVLSTEKLSRMHFGAFCPVSPPRHWIDSVNRTGR